jgi:hypothetical protein
MFQVALDDRRSLILPGGSSWWFTVSALALGLGDAVVGGLRSLSSLMLSGRCVRLQLISDVLRFDCSAPLISCQWRDPSGRVLSAARDCCESITILFLVLTDGRSGVGRSLSVDLISEALRVCVCDMGNL